MRTTVNCLIHFLILHLDKNHFSGLAPESNIPGLQNFNVSGTVFPAMGMGCSFVVNEEVEDK
jgi:hypothetical protein